MILKVCATCRVAMPTECFSKHSGRRDGLMGHCRSCRQTNRNHESERQRRVARYHANREAELAKQREWQANNRETLRQACKAWRARNPGAQHAAGAAWRKANPHKNAALAAKRNAAKRRRTPPWLTPEMLFAIQQFYEAAAIATRMHGVKYVVDHIVPLQGENVCGLHVPWNLQVISNAENVRKGNRFV